MRTLIFPLALMVCLNAPIAVGEMLPSFEIDRVVMESSFILEGKLAADGTLEVSQVHKGQLQLPAKCKLSQGNYSFSSFSKSMEKDPPKSWLVFAASPGDEGDYSLVLGSASVIVVSQADKVYAWLPSFGWGGAAIAAHDHWTSKSFLAELNQAMQRTEKLGALLELPRSVTRVRELIRFVESNAPWPPHQDEKNARGFDWPGYLFQKVAVGLYHPSSEEESALADLLRAAATDEQKSLVLAVIANIKPTPSLFKAVLPWVDVSTPKLTRREAIRALLACDAYEGAGVLAQFLRADDQLLDVLVASLSNSGWSREDNAHHPAVIKRLSELGRQILDQSKTRDNNAVNRGYACLGLIQSYIHPELLPLLVEWSGTSETSTHAQALSNLRSILGLSDSKTTDKEVIDWWSKNKAWVVRPYDLTKPDELDVWLTEWRTHDDPVARKVLLYHWDFQPAIPEQELLKRCEGAEPVKLVLAELWQRKRLSAGTRKEIVRRYVKMKIVMQPNRYTTKAIPGEVSIQSERRFPFPEAAWINCTGDLAANREAEIVDHQSGGSWSLSGKGPMGFYGASGTGDLSVKGIVEVWEKDYHTSPPKELWRLRWKLSQTYREKVIEVEAEPD